MRVLILFLTLWASTAWAANFRPEQFMVLVVSASASPADPDVTAVVKRLQELRQEPSFAPLKMGTMHFDRPSQAHFAQTVLGLQRADLPCLCLVQLDAGLRYPAKRVYSISRVKAPQVELVAQRWASISGIDQNQPEVLMTPVPRERTAWTTNQIRSLAQAAEEACQDVTDGQQLSAACHALNQALSEGIQNPPQQWQTLLRAQRSWQSRAGNSPGQLKARALLSQLEQAYWQLNGDEPR